MTTLEARDSEELGRSVRAACDRLATEDRVREIAFGREGSDRGFDAELWGALCAQVGVTAIGLPERFGGAGYGVAALAVVARELGRALAPVPFVASNVLAADLLLAADDPELIVDTLAALTEGERTAAAVVTIDGGLWQRNNVAVSATVDEDRWRLTGSSRHVLHGAAADVHIVVADADGELAVFLLDDDSDGVSIEVESVLDWTRPMATIGFEESSARRLTVGPADDIVMRSVERAIAVLSAEQVGATERVVEIAAEYARTRTQFGRQIGSFQAIKHKCADMLVGLEWARSASQAACESVDADDGETGWRVSMAKAVCSESLRQASHDNLQIHGGIGFTWEDSSHLYLKRARTDEVLFGSPGAHWDKLGSEAKLL